MPDAAPAPALYEAFLGVLRRRDRPRAAVRANVALPVVQMDRADSIQSPSQEDGELDWCGEVEIDVGDPGAISEFGNGVGGLLGPDVRSRGVGKRRLSRSGAWGEFDPRRVCSAGRCNGLVNARPDVLAQRDLDTCACAAGGPCRSVVSLHRRRGVSRQHRGCPFLVINRESRHHPAGPTECVTDRDTEMEMASQREVDLAGTKRDDGLVGDARECRLQSIDGVRVG